MAKAIDSAPASKVYAKNPIWYVLSTDQFITPGVLPNWVLALDADGPVDGNHFTITIDDTEIRIDFIGNTLADNPFEVHANYNLQDMDVYGAALLTELKANHALSAYFDIEIILDTANRVEIKFTSRFGKGFTRAYTINQASDSYTSGSASAFTENYKIVIEAWLETGFQTNEYTHIDTLEQAPDTENQEVKFNLMAQIMSHLGHELPEHLPSSTKVKMTTRLQGRFFIKYTDKSGSPISQNDWEVELNNHLAHLAGVSKVDFPGSDFSNDWHGKALTRQPDTRVVATDQLEYLYFINIGNQSGLVPEVTVYFTDGTNTSWVPASVSDTVKKDQIVYAAVGYDQLDIGSADPDKTVHKYTVKYTNPSPGVDLTQVITYLVDHHHHDYSRKFLFPNGLGGYDTLHCTGSQADTLNRNVEIGEKPVKQGALVTDSELVTIPEDPEKDMEVSAGPFDAQYARYLEDLFNDHGQVYLIGDNDFIPVVIISSGIELIDEENDVHQVTFTYRYAFDTKNSVQ